MQARTWHPAVSSEADGTILNQGVEARPDAQVDGGHGLCGDPEPAWHWYSACKNRKTVIMHILTYLFSSHTIIQGTHYAFQLSIYFTTNIISQPSQNTINTQSHFEAGDNRRPRDALVDTKVMDMPGNEPWRAAAILLDAMK